MCELCDGSFERIETLEVARAAQRLMGVYEFGAMHIVVADCNVEDEHLEYCLAHPEVTDQEKAACALLLQLDEDARISALAKSQHLWGCTSIYAGSGLAEAASA